MISQLVGSRPASGSVLPARLRLWSHSHDIKPRSTWSLLKILSLSPSLPLPLSPAHSPSPSLSLSLKNKQTTTTKTTTKQLPLIEGHFPIAKKDWKCMHYCVGKLVSLIHMTRQDCKLPLMSSLEHRRWIESWAWETCIMEDDDHSTPLSWLWQNLEGRGIYFFYNNERSRTKGSVKISGRNKEIIQ